METNWPKVKNLIRKGVFRNKGNESMIERFEERPRVEKTRTILMTFVLTMLHNS